MTVKHDRVVARQPRRLERWRQEQRIEPRRPPSAQVAGRQQIGVVAVLTQRLDALADGAKDGCAVVGGTVNREQHPHVHAGAPSAIGAGERRPANTCSRRATCAATVKTSPPARLRSRMRPTPILVGRHATMASANRPWSGGPSGTSRPVTPSSQPLRECRRRRRPPTARRAARPPRRPCRTAPASGWARAADRSVEALATTVLVEPSGEGDAKQRLHPHQLDGPRASARAACRRPKSAGAPGASRAPRRGPRFRARRRPPSTPRAVRDRAAATRRSGPAGGHGRCDSIG